MEAANFALLATLRKRSKYVDANPKHKWMTKDIRKSIKQRKL